MIQIKRVFFIVLLLGATGFCAFAQNAMTLGQAIKTSSGEIGARLETGTTIAVVDFRSSSNRMSEYMLEELNTALFNERNLIVVGRGATLELARNEVGLGLSPELSDASAQRIGHLLGAKMVVSGSLSIAGDHYSFRVQVLEAETAAIRYSNTFNVLNDRQVRTLMGGEALVANFTPGERAGAAALNLGLGMGSFVIQKDAKGGAITAVLEALGVAAVVVSPFLVTQKVDVWTGLWYDDYSISTPAFYAGIAAYAGGAIYGVFRALSYRKPGVNVAEAPLPWNIALVPTASGNTAMRLGYTLRF